VIASPSNPGNVSQYGINNWWYVNGVEGFVAPFATGSLPK
jgi:hypothetical protein